MPVGMVDTNCYILHNENTLEGILIDPGAEAERILSRINAQGFKISAILLTHGHFDHVEAAEELAKILGVKIYSSAQDAVLAADPKLNGSQLLLKRDITCAPNVYLDDEQILEKSWIKIYALLTPGHTSGHMCYYIPQSDTLFSGDLLFKGSYGRHDLPTSNFNDLKRSLERLFALPPETKVYPGHGSPTTIEYESKHNPILKS